MSTELVLAVIEAKPSALPGMGDEAVFPPFKRQGLRYIISDPDRDHDARFQKGGKGGPGRPRRAIESDYLAKLSEAVPLSVLQEIVAKAVEDAREGDHAARVWLANYLVGKPTGDALRNLAVDEEVGVDPLAQQISQEELMAVVLGVMKKSYAP